MTSTSKTKVFFEFLKLDRPRTPGQMESLLADVKRGFDASAELRRESRRYNGGLNKKYFEEIYPLTLLARHLFAGRNDVLCEPNLDDTKSFDAVITIGSGPGSDATKLLVEFTYAKDGYDEALRMEKLNDQGHVSLTASLTRTGTKKTGRHITIGEDILERRDDRLKECLRLILDRIARKAGPRYSGVHALAVVFDDILGFRKPEEIALLRTSIESSVRRSTLNFRTLILLGSSGNVFLEFPLSESR
jgi:hypothetical protein